MAAILARGDELTHFGLVMPYGKNPSQRCTRAGMSNNIPHKTTECDYLFMPTSRTLCDEAGS